MEHPERIGVDPNVNKAKTVLIFFVCGLAAGLGFSALLSSPRLLTFWFIKGDKFLMPTYRYYLGVGLFFLLSLSAPYWLSKMTGLISKNPPLLRKILSAGIVATSPVILLATAITIERLTATTQVTDTGTILLTNIDPITLYLWGILAFVLLISAACWILTGRLYYVGLCLNFLTLPLAFALLYVAAKIVRVPSEWSELITYPIYFSLLAASCAFWISAGERTSE